MCGSVSHAGPSIPTTSRPRLIRPFDGCISRSNVTPTATVLTRTGKKMTDRTVPLTCNLWDVHEHRQGHSDHHLESAGGHGVDDGVAEALGQCRLPEELSEVGETDPLPIEQRPTCERVEQRECRRDDEHHEEEDGCGNVEPMRVVPAALGRPPVARRHLHGVGMASGLVACQRHSGSHRHPLRRRAPSLETVQVKIGLADSPCQ